MIEVKKKVMGDLQGMLDDRLASRLMKKPVMEGASEQGEDHGMEESPEHEGMESPMEEKQEGDISKLTPEEQHELERLYAKMGC